MLRGFEQILKELEDIGKELDSMQKEMTGFLVKKISGIEKVAMLISHTTRKNEVIIEREIQRITPGQKESNLLEDLLHQRSLDSFWRGFTKS